MPSALVSSQLFCNSFIGVKESCFTHFLSFRSYSILCRRGFSSTTAVPGISAAAVEWDDDIGSRDTGSSKSLWLQPLKATTVGRGFFWNWPFLHCLRYSSVTDVIAFNHRDAKHFHGIFNYFASHTHLRVTEKKTFYCNIEWCFLLSNIIIWKLWLFFFLRLVSELHKSKCAFYGSSQNRQHDMKAVTCSYSLSLF